ncbi:MAG TPA: pseudaminic acid cytidylyltransferase [Candidatus Aquicultor sp.]|jgi:N-acylneuraminate cytidylyltransferase
MSGRSLAIITARGGSKRIPRKNIRAFLGYPIIKYSIDAAMSAGCFDEVMVSTDDEEIAGVAKELGAEVPFLRSEASSSDLATTADVIEEVLLEYKKRDEVFSYCCCIYPTAPFISLDNLKDGFSTLKTTSADSVLPVVRFSYPIQRALKIENGRLSMIWPENMDSRSQDLMSTYHDAGQFYWLKVGSFLRQKKLFMDNTYAVEVPESEVQDIDNEEDWKIAEMKYRILRGV